MNLDQASVYLLVEIIVAVAIFLVVVGIALFGLKAEHMDGEPGRVRLGAAISGLVLGGVVGFLVLPLRFALVDSADPDPRLALALPAAVVLLIAMRRGALGRAPVIGKAVRAYRKALLRRTIANAEKSLAKLSAHDASDPAPT